MGPDSRVAQKTKQANSHNGGSVSSSKNNSQQKNCYCGEELLQGKSFKIIQCCRCKQWFHEGCIKCLMKPLLYGDRFYIFICAVCNSGKEFIKRMNMTWVDVVHLVIFHLSIVHNKTYYDVESAIIHFMTSNWDLMQVTGEPAKTSRKQWKAVVLSTLESDHFRFKCGRETKKKTTIWGLRAKIPPPVSKASLLFDESCVEQLKNLNQRQAQKMNSSFSPLPSSSQRRAMKSGNNNVASDAGHVGECSGKSFRKNLNSTFTNTKDHSALMQSQKAAGDIEIHQNEMDARTKLSGSQPLKTKALMRNRLTSISRNCDNQNNVRCPKANGGFAHARSVLNVDDLMSSKISLETVIPAPANFDGCNNPFSNSHPSVARSQKRRLVDEEACSCRRADARRRRPPGRQPSVVRDRFIMSGRKDGEEGCQRASHVCQYSVACQQATNGAPLRDLNSSMNHCFKAENSVGAAENCKILASRVTTDGKVQYLIEWGAFGM